MNPPSTMELLLTGLIPDRNQRQAIIGDMAEEWRERCDQEGPRAANRWYIRETLASSGPLMIDWVKRTPAHIVVAVVVAGIVIGGAAQLVGAVVTILAAVPARALGVPPWINTLPASLGNAAVTFAAGAIVARIFRRAPAPAVIWLATVLLISTVTMSEVVTSGALPGWYPVPVKFIGIVGAMAGARMMARRAAPKVVG